MKSFKNRAPDDDGTLGPTSWRIRALKESDLEAAMAIERVSFPSPWSKAAFRQELNNPYSHCWVALEPNVHASERLAGYICCWMITDEVQIMNLAIRPVYRRHGVARRLLEFALADAMERGARRAILEVRPSNAAALSLYQSMQFREAGRRPRYYKDTGEDAIIMLRRLVPDP